MTLPLALAAAYLWLLGGKVALAIRAARAEAPVPASRGAGVVVLQAILSGDPRLGAVLADNLRTLPEARFLWLVDADDVDGQSLCRTLAASFAAVAVTVLVLPPPPPRLNPKLWKLEAARGHAREPVVLVLDDDTRMPAATLAALLRALDAHTLATSLPSYVTAGGWPTRLLSQFVANNAATTYLPLLPWLSPVTINGMAYALRRDALDRLGGFAPVLGHLADDLAVAGLVRRHGGTIFQSARPHVVETTVRDWTHYVRLMHRWFVFALVLQRAQRPALQALIALLHGLPPLLFLALAVLLVRDPASAGLPLAAVVLAVRAGLLLALHRATGVRGSHGPLASVLAELLQPLHLLHGLVARRIVWRSRRYRVRSDTDFEAL